MCSDVDSNSNTSHERQSMTTVLPERVGSKMTSLLVLPSELWIDSIVSQLSLEEICRLDSAVVNHALRTLLFNVLRSLVLENLIVDEVDARFVWLVARRIKCEELELWTELDNVAGSVLVPFLERCPPSRSFISLYNTLQDHTCFWLTTNCRNISELHVDDCTGLTMKTLRTISKLRYLKILLLEQIKSRCDGALKCIFKACKKPCWYHPIDGRYCPHTG